MTTANTQHQVAPQVVREVFDDEVIIIDMETGNYFSLNPTGARVWTLIEDGYTVERIVRRLGEEYEDTNDSISAGVNDLISRLLKEGLIGAAEGTDRTPTTEREASAVDKGKFEKPELAVYTDMQELLLLDPIHDVDETGWPQRPDESKV